MYTGSAKKIMNSLVFEKKRKLKLQALEKWNQEVSLLEKIQQACNDFFAHNWDGHKVSICTQGLYENLNFVDIYRV